MADAVFNKAANQGDEKGLNSRTVKTVSMGWGQEEIKSSGQAETLAPQVPKSRGSYFFVRHP